MNRRKLLRRALWALPAIPLAAIAKPEKKALREPKPFDWGKGDAKH